MLSILCCFMHLFQSGILSGSEYKYTPVQGGWLGIVPPLQPWFWPAVLASLSTDYQSPSNMYQSYKVMEDGWDVQASNYSQGGAFVHCCQSKFKSQIKQS